MSKIIVALDFQTASEAMQFLDKVSPELCHIKIGKGMFTQLGPDFVRAVIALGFKVFLDLKFHDIPNTVADACRAAAGLNVWMLNVHASGGLEMMQAAKNALQTFENPPLLIAVTLLTSLNADSLKNLGISLSVSEYVLRLAQLAYQAKLDGVVCSADEAVLLRTKFGDHFNLVTPGIRLEEDAKDDQKRIVTPDIACKNGADYLVIGRPITLAKDPAATLEKIIHMIPT